MRMQIMSHTTINASAADVWRVIAHQFAAIGEWASSIPISSAAPEAPVPVGADVGARVCATGVRGFRDICEQFTSYDEGGNALYLCSDRWAPLDRTPCGE
jgi:hypothetical protein